MSAVSDVMVILHLTLLFGLLGVTSLLLLVTVMNRLRLRSIIMSWQAGQRFGIPAAPAGFIVLLFAGFILAELLHRPVSVPLIAAYLTGGLFWLMASYFARTVVITEHGMITNVNCTDRSIAWGQIVDYFEYTSRCGRGYVFFFSDASGLRQRVQISVPQEHDQRFKAIIAAKLDLRFEFAAKQTYGKTAMER